MTTRTRARELEGIVLHLTSYGESDRIVEILSSSEGRFSALARGARRSRRRFGGVLDLFVRLRVQVSDRGSLWTLQAADMIEPHLGLRSEWKRIQWAATLCEISRTLCPEHMEATDAFGALGDGLRGLAAGEWARAAAAGVALLQAAGIAPDSFCCSRCGSEGPFAILDARGPTRCLRCAPGARKIPEGVVAALCGAPVSTDDAPEVMALVVRWVEHQADRALRSAGHFR